MTSPRSMFTEAIEDHLALKKQNAHLSAAMPLSRYDVGDPLHRYPGGPVRPATDDVIVVPEEDELIPPVAGSPLVDAPAHAMGAAQVAADVAATVVEGDFSRPAEPLNGMTPMLSLVEDIDDEDADDISPAPVPASVGSLATVDTIVQPQVLQPQGDVVRFPGGAGPRDEHAAMATAAAQVADDAELEEPTGEQPVIVIDADEPLAPPPLHSAPFSTPQPSRRGRSFFGLRRKNRREDLDGGADGWFSGAPREFTWDD